MTEAKTNEPLVLIVDDDEATRDMYAEWLAYSGFRVAVAATATEAISMAARLNPTSSPRTAASPRTSASCPACPSTVRSAAS